jgi:hypothetical protein
LGKVKEQEEKYKQIFKEREIKEQRQRQVAAAAEIEKRKPKQISDDAHDDDLKQLRLDRVKGLLSALEYAEDVDSVKGILTVVPAEVEFVNVRKQAELKLKKLQQKTATVDLTVDQIDDKQKPISGHNDAIFQKIIDNLNTTLN